MASLSFSPYTLNEQVLFHVYTPPLNSSVSTQANTMNWFNDSELGVRRFDPIYQANGTIIPCFYGALSDLTALGESIVRQPQRHSLDTVTQPVRTLSWQPETAAQQQNGQIKKIAQLTIHRTLTLIDVNTVLTNRCNPLQAWLAEGESAYPALQNVAAWFAQHYPKHHGLIWHSFHGSLPNDRAFLLFGDRVKSDDLQLISWEPLNSENGLKRIRETVRTLNVITPEWLMS